MEYPQNNNTQPLADGFNFTPYSPDLGCRVRMRIDRTLLRGSRGRGLRGIVTDLDSGIKYKVYGMSCGLPRCMCDAKIVEIP